MKVEVRDDAILLVPETTPEKYYLQLVMGLNHKGDKLEVVNCENAGSSYSYYILKKEQK